MQFPVHGKLFSLYHLKVTSKGTRQQVKSFYRELFDFVIRPNLNDGMPFTPQLSELVLEKDLKLPAKAGSSKAAASKNDGSESEMEVEV